MPQQANVNAFLDILVSCVMKVRLYFCICEIVQNILYVHNMHARKERAVLGVRLNCKSSAGTTKLKPRLHGHLKLI